MMPRDTAENQPLGSKLLSQEQPVLGPSKDSHKFLNWYYRTSANSGMGDRGELTAGWESHLGRLACLRWNRGAHREGGELN